MTDVRTIQKGNGRPLKYVHFREIGTTISEPDMVFPQDVTCIHYTVIGESLSNWAFCTSRNHNPHAVIPPQTRVVVVA